MSTFALDSSCMVAAVCGWHERHGVVTAAIERRLDRGARLVSAAHALAETYAMLTRLPAPHRVSPSDAWALIRANFVEPARVIALSGRAHVVLLGTLAERGVAGGKTCDAVILATLEAQLPLELLTLNPRHFDSREGLTVVEPGTQR